MTPAPAPVDGIPFDAVSFYAELDSSNTREWWEANRDRYAASVREPMSHLADVLTDEFGEAKVFRPNRDVRFSKDKSPYKDHQGVFVGLQQRLGWYVQIGADGLLTAGGFYAAEPDQLAGYRAAVDDDASGRQLMDIVDALLDKGFDIGGDLLATRPRGIPRDHPRLELLRHRTLTARRQHGTPEWLESDEAGERVRDDWRELRPLVEWCDQHLGESARPRRR